MHCIYVRTIGCKLCGIEQTRTEQKLFYANKAHMVIHTEYTNFVQFGEEDDVQKGKNNRGEM
jgi:hypothetical protein